MSNVNGYHFGNRNSWNTDDLIKKIKDSNLDDIDTALDADTINKIKDSLNPDTSDAFIIGNKYQKDTKTIEDLIAEAEAKAKTASKQKNNIENAFDAKESSEEQLKVLNNEKNELLESLSGSSEPDKGKIQEKINKIEDQIKAQENILKASNAELGIKSKSEETSERKSTWVGLSAEQTINEATQTLTDEALLEQRQMQAKRKKASNNRLSNAASSLYANLITEKSSTTKTETKSFSQLSSDEILTDDGKLTEAALLEQRQQQAARKKTNGVIEQNQNSVADDLNITTKNKYSYKANPNSKYEYVKGNSSNGPSKTIIVTDEDGVTKVVQNPEYNAWLESQNNKKEGGTSIKNTNLGYKPVSNDNLLNDDGTLTEAALLAQRQEQAARKKAAASSSNTSSTKSSSSTNSSSKSSTTTKSTSNSNSSSSTKAVSNDNLLNDDGTLTEAALLAQRQEQAARKKAAASS